MMTDTQERAYLDELRRALAGRPAEERELVVDGVRQHIADARAAGTPLDEVLAGLGDPLQIAGESTAPTPAPPAPFLDRRSGAVLTVLLLAFGGVVVPVLGWVVGLVLLWSSHGWRVRDKVLGTIAGPAGFVVLLLGRALGIALPSTPAWTLLLAAPLVEVVVAVLLLLRFRSATGA